MDAERMGMPHDRAGDRALAVAVSVAMLALMAALLRIVPEASPVRDERIRVRWMPTVPESRLPPTPAQAAASEAPASAPVDIAPAAHGAGMPLRETAPVEPSAVPVPSPAQPAASAPALDLRYPGTRGEVSFAAPKPADGGDIFQRKPSFQADQTVFDKPVERRDGRRQNKREELLYGKDIRHVDPPRPPPDVPFKPSLHGNPADVTSVAQVSQLPVPGLDGEAGRLIGSELDALRGQAAACPARDAALAGPVAQLKELRRLEHRYHNGADPQEREHLLPRRIGKAWNDARRALWQARQQLGGCIDGR